MLGICREVAVSFVTQRSDAAPPRDYDDDVRLDPPRVAVFANDVAWAFGLTDTAGNRLVFDTSPKPGASGEKRARAVIAELRNVLANVRPAPRAPSIGELVAILEAPTATTTAKARRRALAELVELVAQGTHHRAKRQERGRVLAEIVLLFGLEAALGASTVPVSSDADVVAAFAGIDRAVTALQGR